MTTTPIDGWCDCGYRRSAHRASDKYCPIQPSGGNPRTFKTNPGSDRCDALHEAARARRDAGDQIGLDL